MASQQDQPNQSTNYLDLLNQDQQNLARIKNKALQILELEELEFLLHYNDNYHQCKQFTARYFEKTGKLNDGKIDRTFITQMVKDEFEELAEAKNTTEEIDALIDSVYYILQHVSRTSLPWHDLFRIVHSANMTKFSDRGQLLPNGKWQKSDDFYEPDHDMEHVIAQYSS